MLLKLLKTYNLGMGDDAYSKFLEHSKTTHAMGRVGEVDEVRNTHARGWVEKIMYTNAIGHQSFFLSKTHMPYAGNPPDRQSDFFG